MTGGRNSTWLCVGCLEPAGPLLKCDIPVLLDPELPDGIVVFRDREGNVLHTVALAPEQ